MVIKETSTGYEKGNKYEVNNNLKSNFHLKEKSNIRQVKDRIKKFGFEVENLNSKGNRKGKNIFMFLETPDNQNKVIPNTFEYDVTKENPNKNMNCELLLKIMNMLIDPSMAKKSKTRLAEQLGTTINIMNNNIKFLKEIGFIDTKENKNFHWLIIVEKGIMRPAKKDEYLPFYKTLKESNNFDKTKEFFGYFCYRTVQYGINTEHKLLKYTNIKNISKEQLTQFENEFKNEFGIGFDFNI